MPEQSNTQTQRKTKTGHVVSSAMDKTIVVRVERILLHPLVKKYVRKHKKYYAHDEANACQVGDRVRIVECRPLSRLKRWQLAEVIEKAK